MGKLLMPSQKKLFNLGGGWHAKETVEGARGLYHESIFRPMRWYDHLFNKSGMATVYGDHFTLVRSGRLFNPNAQGGRQRALYWEFLSLPAGNVGDVLVCGKMYKGERFVGGLERHSALAAAGGPAEGAYGTYAVADDGITLGAVIDADEYIASADWDAAAGSVLGATVALSFGLVCTADQFLCCTNAVGVFATAGIVMGVVNLTGS